DRDGKIVGIGWKLNGDAGRNQLIGPGVNGTVIKPAVELGLGLRLRSEIDEFPGELAIRRSFEDAPGAGAAHGPLPHELDRDATLLELGGARVPDRHHVDLAIADKLLGLVALPPPYFDMRFDAVEHLEGSLDIERIELVPRHSVREQGENHVARGIVDAQRARTGKFLNIPEVGPRSRAGVGKLVRAIA